MLADEAPANIKSYKIVENCSLEGHPGVYSNIFIFILSSLPD